MSLIILIPKLLPSRERLICDQLELLVTICGPSPPPYYLSACDMGSTNIYWQAMIDADVTWWTIWWTESWHVTGVAAGSCKHTQVTDAIEIDGYIPIFISFYAQMIFHIEIWTCVVRHLWISVMLIHPMMWNMILGEVSIKPPSLHYEKRLWWSDTSATNYFYWNILWLLYNYRLMF